MSFSVFLFSVISRLFRCMQHTFRFSFVHSPSKGGIILHDLACNRRWLEYLFTHGPERMLFLVFAIVLVVVAASIHPPLSLKASQFPGRLQGAAFDRCFLTLPESDWSSNRTLEYLPCFSRQYCQPDTLSPNCISFGP